MQCGVGRYFRAALQIRKNRPFPIKPHRKIIGNGRFWVYLEKWCTYIETHISHTDHSPTWEYLQVRSLGHQILTSHLQHYPGSSRIILAHSELFWLIQNYPGSSRIILDHSGPPQLIQVHPGPSRIIRPIQNQTGPSNQTPTSPFGSPLTWVTPLRSTSSIEVPVNWGTRPGLEPPQPGHSFSCWSYSVNSSDMAATSDLEASDLAQHLRPCEAPQTWKPQALRSTSGFT